MDLFFGHEDRAEVGTHVFIRSVIARSTIPVALHPITRRSTPRTKEGTNAFTFRRFLVPWLVGYRGWALFADGSDMVCLGDVAELWSLFDPYKAVQVVKHRYETKHSRKYVGTGMEADNGDYERKQWASLMLINCNHFAWRQVNPEFVAKTKPMDLLQFRFIDDDRIGELPIEWNWLVDEHGENKNAKLLHFTAGIPAFEAHADAPMADVWRSELASASTTLA